MTRLWLTVAAVGVAGTLCIAQAPGSGDASRVQSDVKALVDALHHGDLDTVVRYTHPRVIAMQGGPTATRKAIEDVMLKFKGTGMRVESFTFPRPPEFLEGGGRRFAVVPTLSILAFNDQRFESLNFQVGVLEPGSPGWVYIEGSRLTRQNVQALFPGFPSGYEFPHFYRKKLP